jgi:hypothetical protein
LSKIEITEIQGKLIKCALFHLMGEQLDLKKKTKKDFESNSKKIIIAIDSAFAKKNIQIFGCQKREVTNDT